MLANLRALFSVTVDLVRFKGGPENLPASASLLAVVVAVFAAVTALTVSMVLTPEQAQRWPLDIVVSIVGTLLFFQWCLLLARKRERFVQTMTAVFAARTLFTPVVLPIAATIAAQLRASQPTPASLAMLAIAFGIWAFVVEVRIIRAAFEWPFAGAIGLMLAQNFTVMVLLALVLSAVGVQPS